MLGSQAPVLEPAANNDAAPVSVSPISAPTSGSASKPIAPCGLAKGTRSVKMPPATMLRLSVWRTGCDELVSARPKSSRHTALLRPRLAGVTADLQSATLVPLEDLLSMG